MRKKRNIETAEERLERSSRNTARRDDDRDAMERAIDDMVKRNIEEMGP